MKFERLAQVATLVAVAFCMGAAPVVAKATGGSKAKVPVKTTPKVAVKTTPKGGAMTHGAASGTRGPASTAHGPKTTAHPSKPARPTSPTTHGNSSKGTGTGGTATTTTTTSTTPTRAQQLLAQNTKLRDKLRTRLPAGTDMDLAASGFRNLGQFVAAVNVSNNLGLSFDDLKARMTGTNPVSLGQAIQQVKGLDAATATTTAQTALTQADREIQSTTTVTTTKTKGKAKTHS
ncbi:MAG TPA: hypothetical protein VEQ84_08620 [Vicinamibacteria bacterium]|nr:hypothetical protein [Vicinamibacteria bacterium]